MLNNLHTHTFFSDGSSAPEEYLEEAINQGFSVLGFSDHSPVPFENTFAIKEERLDEYCKVVRGLNGGSITILIGLEIDYIPGVTKSIEDYRKKNHFDYFIGSVHLVRNGNNTELWFIDGPDIAIYDEGLTKIFKGDIRHGVKSYYHQINQMILTQKPDIIGHLDKIKMHNRNRYFQEDENWYVQLVDETLDLIKENQCVVEVNTRGIYKKRSDTLFPGPEILKKIKKLNIPITLSSDAHKPSELSLCFEETNRLLSEIGFRSLSIITSVGWREVPLL